MSRAGVGTVIEKLLTDETMRIRFALDRIETIAELCLRFRAHARRDRTSFAERMLVCGDARATSARESQSLSDGRRAATVPQRSRPQHPSEPGVPRDSHGSPTVLTGAS